MVRHYVNLPGYTRRNVRIEAVQRAGFWTAQPQAFIAGRWQTIRPTVQAPSFMEAVERAKRA